MHDSLLLECVINVSEGRDARRLADITAAAGRWLLDVHTDADHHRSVLTIAGPPPDVVSAVRRVATRAVELIDLRSHSGVHPRMGALDVVPFVSLQGRPLRPAEPSLALEARDAFASWAGRAPQLPCFVYGPERALPEVRKRAWRDLAPDWGPGQPHPTAGATAVGARGVLVAYNLWLSERDLDLARRVAAEVRGAAVRTLGLPVGHAVQVSCNLIDPWHVGPGAVYDLVAARTPIERAELVGLLPADVLDREPRQRWAELGLDPAHTIEARLMEAGLDGGRFPGGAAGREVNCHGGGGST